MVRIVRRPKIDDSHLPSSFSPLLKQIYASRGVTGEAQLQRELSGLIPPTELVGVTEGARLLANAIQQQKRIVIVGDFDADGATSIAVCILALRAFGAVHLDYLVPNRFDFGYGLSPELVEIAKARGAEVLITVDNGISAHAGVDAARAAGMEVVVTDHHLAGETLPNADVIVNPNQPGCSFSSKAIAGVGVAFYLMLVLRGELRQQGWFEQQGLPIPNMAEWLDLVALGTVADVVTLDPNNRLMVHQGLRRIRAGRCRPGIQALLDVAKRSAAQMVASDLGFSLGPRLNAAGRLDDMSLGIDCLLTDDVIEARQIASELDSLNQERREIEQSMQQEAVQTLQQLDLSEESLPWGLALYQPDWHQGVVGILASRIKTQFHRPVIAFADSDDGVIKGSARSIPGLHIRDLLERIDSRHPDLLLKFGGHAMAAGLSLKASDFARFNALFDQEVRQSLDAGELEGELLSDGELTSVDLSLGTAYMLRDAGPWGQGFPEPMFDGQFKVLDQRLVGKKHLKLVLETLCGSCRVDAIAFNVDLDIWPEPSCTEVSVAYRLDINHWRGQDSLQLMVEHLRSA